MSLVSQPCYSIVLVVLKNLLSKYSYLGELQIAQLIERDVRNQYRTLTISFIKNSTDLLYSLSICGQAAPISIMTKGMESFCIMPWKFYL